MTGPSGDEQPSAAEVTEDALLGGRVRIVQPRAGFRAAIDPVLLAAAVPAGAGERALDVGCGTGAAALCLAARVPGVTVVGIDADKTIVALACRGAIASGLADCVSFMSGDVGAAFDGSFEGGFDHVLTNPPFAPAGRGTPSPNPARRRATEEREVDLGRWLAFCVACARAGGTVTVIHRADRLEEVLAGLAPGAADAVVLPLLPAADGRPAKRVIARARKGAQGPPRCLDGLVLHRPSGGYSDEAEAILRHARALVL